MLGVTAVHFIVSSWAPATDRLSRRHLFSADHVGGAAADLVVCPKYVARASWSRTRQLSRRI